MRESKPTKKFIVDEDADNSPLKRPVKIITEDVENNNTTLMPPAIIKTELAKRIEADKISCAQSVISATCTDASSYMCSQAGSPFKKARRTRDERRRKKSLAKENT